MCLRNRDLWQPGDQVVSESSHPGQGFLAETCRAWEAEALRAADAGIRVMALRFGVVLAPEGGARKELLPIFRSGFAGRLSSGRQWMSLITMDDLLRATPERLTSPDFHFDSPEFSTALGATL